jgi:TRAP-type C4-dicarboxylate transport system permease small subunit
MSKRQIIVLLGVWIAVFPFLGFPSAWRDIILPVSGLLVAFVALRMKSETSQSDAGKVPFVDYKNDSTHS